MSVGSRVRRTMWVWLAACSDDSFYTDPVPDLARYEPGDVIRWERIGRTSAVTLGLKAGVASPHAAEVYRVLYRTTGVDGEPDLASARLALPDEPSGPRPIVAHLHGTTGLADRCAPSRDGGFGFESATNPNAARMLARGAVVVEPDYLGLGPPGPHPYVAARPTGTSVLDGIRAASRFEDPERELVTGEPPLVLLEGHSQGGHAVLAALREAPSYAPELPITGALAISAPGSPDPLIASLLADDVWGGFVAMATTGWSAVHPDLGPPEDWVRDEDLLDRLENDCLFGLAGWLEDPPSEVLAEGVAEAALAGDLEALGAALAEEDLSTLETDADVLVVHGTEDELLPIELTEDLALKLALRSDVTFAAVEGGDHLLLPWTARYLTLPFLEDRLTED